MSNFCDFGDVLSDCWVSLTMNPGVASPLNGVSLNTVLEELYNRIPDFAVVSDENGLMPLIMDEQAILHPIFKDLKKKPDFPLCGELRGFSRKRLPQKFFTEEGNRLDIYIFDTSAECPVASISYPFEEYLHEGWIVCDKICMPRAKIPELIRLVSTIRDAEISDLLK